MFMKHVVICGLLAASTQASGARLKDFASIEGVRDNQLIGYGIVVGLSGTGDKQLTLFSTQTLSNMLQRMGVTVNPTTIQVHNMASVMVTATLPPFAQPGTRIDATTAAIGDATNLQGGILLMTPLKAANGETYAVAQGPVLTGGFIARGAGNSQTVNHPTVGRTPDGAIVERSPPSLQPSSHLKLQLRQSDFTTATRVVDAINKHFGSPSIPVARAESAGLLVVDVPPSYSTRAVEFISEMESLTVDADRPARIIINERTGTIVMGKDVRITPVAIMHGALSVEIRTRIEVSQPGPLSNGTTAVVPQTTVNATDSKAKALVLEKGATVEELVRALQAIGSTPRDVLAILQAMRSASALDAEIEVI
jgi:flagellar P-ring protein precursor FlgI